MRPQSRGFTPFLDMVAGVSNLSQNYAGEDVLGNWDDKIQSMKAMHTSDEPLPGEELEGADDDEWD